MKTPQSLQPWGVDSVGYGNRTGRMPKRMLTALLLQNQLGSVSATIKLGKSLPVARVKGIEGCIGLTTPASPVRDRTSTPDRIRRGKWVLHV